MHGLVIACLIASVVFVDQTSASVFVDHKEATVSKGYHAEVGIPRAAEIKAIEDGLFKGRSAPFKQSDERIVGGAVAPVNSYPYLAGLVVYFVNSNLVSACGSSLLSTTRLVTAAHCWFDGVNQARQFEVVLGSSFLFNGGTRIFTSQVIMHPGWIPSLLRNDVAMIYLPRSVVTSASIQPIALPSVSELNEQFVGLWTMAAGYGKTDDAQTGVSTNTVIRHVNLQVITNQLCASIYNQLAEYVTQSNICTNGIGGVGICGGDSGGPLAVMRNGRPTLIGISSFAANNACQGGYPSGFARVTSFYSFIMQHLW